METIVERWERITRNCNDCTKCEQCSNLVYCTNIAKEEKRSRKNLSESKKHKKIVDYCVSHECEKCGIGRRACKEASLTDWYDVNRLYSKVETAEMTIEAEEYILKKEEADELFRRLIKAATELAETAEKYRTITKSTSNPAEIIETELPLRWAMAEVMVMCNLFNNDVDAREDLEHTQKVIKEMWVRSLQSEEESE